MIDLNQIPNKNTSPFDVPQGYFDGLESRVIATVKRRKKIKLVSQVCSVAALLAIMIITPWHNERTKDLDYVLENASYEELYAVIDMAEFDPLNQ